MKAEIIAVEAVPRSARSQREQRLAQPSLQRREREEWAGSASGRSSRSRRARCPRLDLLKLEAFRDRPSNIVKKEEEEKHRKMIFSKHAVGWKILDYLLQLRFRRLLPPIILHGSSKGLRFQSVEEAVDRRWAGEQEGGQRSEFRVIVEILAVANVANFPKNQSAIGEIKQVKRAD